MVATLWIVLLLLGSPLLRTPFAADQAILGKQVQVKDPKPGVDPTRRKVIVQGKETASTNTLVGDPTVSGATLSIFTNGATLGTQSFVLPPALWSTAGAAGFKYKDVKHSAGPVKVAQIKKSRRGTFQIKALVRAKGGSITLLPPNPGAAACVLFEIDGGDSYHVLLPAGSTIQKNDDQAFLIEDALVEGLCDCQVAIVGGGAGGVYTALRLSDAMASGVCLFESEAELGGRIKDVPRDDSDPTSPRVGVGARRVMNKQTVVLDLAQDLGLTLETPPIASDLLNARGHFAFSTEDFVAYYPGLVATGITDLRLYLELLTDAKRANVDAYPDFASYVRDVIGDAGYDFLHDMSRFRGDFEAPLSARSYLDFAEQEAAAGNTPSYPVGGMSAFIRAMADRAKANHARIFTSDPVQSLARDDGRYRIISGGHDVHATKVVIAIPPNALEQVRGDVVDDIKAQPEFKDIIGIPVVTITQWWPTAWWEGIRDPGVQDVPGEHSIASPGRSGQIWRVWTTENCVQFVEIPQEAYAAAQHVTRSVYADDADCVAFWNQTAKDGTAAIESAVNQGLEYLFTQNGITNQTPDIPAPTKTYFQYWPAAWHWLRAGATSTNASVFDWAASPLGDEPVGLVGEAYNSNRSGWTDGAYKSAMNLLNARYGFSLP